MKPLISIVVPVYNAEKTLERCLDSVLQQSFRDYEVILINDGSQDQSSRICERYAATDDRIRVLHQDNHGVSHARNAGIDIACGTYITFLDSDDWIVPLHLEQYYHAITQFDCDVVIGGYSKIEGSHLTRCLPSKTGCFDNEIWENICLDPSIFGYLWNKLFRFDILKDHSLRLREDMYSQEDLEFCLSVFERANRVAMIECDSYQYYYLSGRRQPPFWDFIANQLKLLRIAQKKANPSGEAIACVQKRILSLLYTGLYVASEQGTFENVIQRIARLEGLQELLEEADAKGEQRFVARNFAAGRYDRIQHYFTIRNRIRDIVRNIRKKCNPTR